MNDTNGNGNTPEPIPFGKRETQVLHPETASELLTMWCERKPVEFGRMLAEVLTGVAPKGR